MDKKSIPKHKQFIRNARQKNRTPVRVLGQPLAVTLNKYLWVLAAFLVPALAYAQVAGTEPTLFGLTASRFFVSVIAGLVLALAFQLVLTNLSVASGLSILGSMTSPGRGPRPEPAVSTSSSSSPEKMRVERQPGERSGIPEAAGSAARKVSSAFGIWALVTASISLFFASWLAVSISPVVSAALGAGLGLVIWGLFYLTTMVLEARAASSLVGSLFGLVSRGVRSASEAVSSAFAKSPAEQAAASAREIASTVREEFFGAPSDFRAQLQDYVNQIKAAQASPEEIGGQIARLLSDTEIQAVSSPEGNRTVLTFLEKHGMMSKEQAQSVAKGMQSAFAKVKEEAQSGKPPAEKVAEGVARVAGVPGEEAKQYREKIENYLRSTGKPQLNPDAIKHDIEQLISSPKAGMESLKNRAGSVDKSTVATLLAQRKDISKEEAQKIVDRVDQVLQTIKGGTQQGAQQAKGGVQAAQGKVQSVIDSATGKIKSYLDSTHKPELSYEGIKADVQKLFQDPRAGFDALITRARSMDRDSIKALLAARKDISERDAERIVSSIESARDTALSKIDQAKAEVARRVDQAKYEAMKSIDEARKTAATAAWWVFATAVVSGIAAVLGGVAGA